MGELPIIVFEWWKDPKGYRLAEVGHPKLLRIVRNGRTRDLELSRPLDSPDTFRIFATTATTPEGLLKFVQRFGPLTFLGNDQGELVGDVTRRAVIMQDTLKWLSAHPRRKPPDLGWSANCAAWLRWDPQAKNLRWQLHPSTLLDGLWLQFAQAVTRGVHIRSCAHCGDLFEAGLGTGRRLDAKFCSDEHRIAFNSLKRSKEK